MPSKKQKKSLVKRDIKKRLMEISFRVDKYIYKNKTITMDEAEAYMQEITFYRTQCNNDMHIQQVIEKLTKCMKFIIKEAKENAPLKSNVPASENDREMSLHRKSSANNKDKEKNDCTFRANNETNNIRISKAKYQKSTADNINVISKRENKRNNNKNKVKPPVYNDNINNLSIVGFSNCFNSNEINNELKSCNINTHGVTQENNIAIDSMRAALLKSTHFTQTDNTKIKNTKPTTPDQIISTDISGKTKEIVIDTCDLAKKSAKTRKNRKKAARNEEYTQQTFVASRCNTKIKNTRNKEKIEEKESLNVSSDCRDLNLEESININTPKILKKPSLNNNTLVSKHHARNRLPQKNIRRNNNTNRNKENASHKECKQITSPSFIAPVYSTAPNKYTDIDAMPREESLSVLKENNNNAVIKQDIMSMGDLKIYNECVLNDLSWIENIRYVREISHNEFEQTPNI